MNAYVKQKRIDNNKITALFYFKQLQLRNKLFLCYIHFLQSIKNDIHFLCYQNNNYVKIRMIGI